MTVCGSISVILPLFLGLASLGAQTPAPATAAAVPPAAQAAAPRSVWEGVYSEEQLSRGKKAYNSLCARCHGENLLGGEEAPALVEKDFLKNWIGKSVGSLIVQTQKTMPSDGPGKLTVQQCTDVTAYVLGANGFPMGKSDLGPDPESLKLILIGTKNETPLGAPLNPVAPLAHAGGVQAQTSAKNGEWRYISGDAGSTKYSPLDQINASNVKDLAIAWRWKAENFGPRPDYNWEVTPLMVGGVLYITAGSRRDVVAVDAATGETLWMYRYDEGERGDRAVRAQNRGLAYWSDGKDDNRVVIISPGYHLIMLDAKTGRPIPTFGQDGIVDLNEGLDRAVVKPGQIGSSSPAIVIRDVVVVGAALLAGTAPVSKENVPGYIRGYDVRTGKLLWTFHTVPQAGEEGVETWEKDSWKYTGNTGAWAPLSGDEELGYVYIPVEAPTGDFYGGTRLGDNLFADSLVCLDAKTGKRVWHFQIIHHDIWDYEPSSPPLLANVTVDGKPRKIVALVTKFAHTYVFDRVTGQPIWPIVETPVPQSTVPGEKTSPTQPIPTKPLPFDRVGVTYDQLIDFTPELHQQAIEILNKYNYGPLFTPPSMRDENGKLGTLLIPNHTGGANWPGGALDPETGIMYVSSLSNTDVLAIAAADPARSDMGYVGAMSARPAATPARGGTASAAAPAATLPVVNSSGGEGGPARSNIGPQGLPLIKPPWGRITAINLNTGDHVWMVPNGVAPDAIKNNPALKGIDLSKAGNPERAHLLVTKTLLFSADGSGLFNAGPGGGGNVLHVLDKKTGATIFELTLPVGSTGCPMSYMVNDRQYIVVAIGARGTPAELIALAIP